MITEREKASSSPSQGTVLEKFTLKEFVFEETTTGKTNADKVSTTEMESSSDIENT